MADILAAEDDRNIRDVLRRALSGDGHEVRFAKDGEEALAAYAARKPDLMILDVMMPRRNGFEVCAEVRRTDVATPVMLLTAKAEESDKVMGFGLGADDYVTKPFGVKEFLARVTALLRRSARTRDAAPSAEFDAKDENFKLGGCIVDPMRMTVRSEGGAECPLTMRELSLVRHFAKNPGKVFSRDGLLNEFWGEGYYGSTRTLDQHIANLRKKLGADGARLEAVPRAGYRFREE